MFLLVKEVMTPHVVSIAPLKRNLAWQAAQSPNAHQENKENDP